MEDKTAVLRCKSCGHDFLLTEDHILKILVEDVKCPQCGSVECDFVGEQG